jgi:hypothetical protein
MRGTKNVSHSQWLPLAGDLLCGFSADTSCRDLGRMGQVRKTPSWPRSWANFSPF